MWGGLGKKKEKENKKRVQLGREVGKREGSGERREEIREKRGRRERNKGG